MSHALAKNRVYVSEDILLKLGETAIWNRESAYLLNLHIFSSTNLRVHNGVEQELKIREGIVDLGSVSLAS